MDSLRYYIHGDVRIRLEKNTFYEADFFVSGGALSFGADEVDAVFDMDSYGNLVDVQNFGDFGRGKSFVEIELHDLPAPLGQPFEQFAEAQRAAGDLLGFELFRGFVPRGLDVDFDLFGRQVAEQLVFVPVVAQIVETLIPHGSEQIARGREGQSRAVSPYGDEDVSDQQPGGIAVGDERKRVSA